ncbi:MAG: hypothetical protein AAB725_01570 [Patescibacteria group bacterium]
MVEKDSDVRDEDVLFSKKEAQRISQNIYREMVESAKSDLQAIDRWLNHDRAHWPDDLRF